MMNIPKIKSFAAPPVDRREIYRYMKCAESSLEIDALIDKALAQCRGELRYDAVFIEIPVALGEDGVVNMGFAKVKSFDLTKALDGCECAVIFAATVGISIDRLISKYGKINPALALCVQAVGAERIEALCDAFCAYLRAQGELIRPRFSAGYGDLPLEFQREIFSLLNCPKAIGLTLNESLLMSPSKSVTAIIGIKKNMDQKNEIT